MQIATLVAIASATLGVLPIYMFGMEQTVHQILNIVHNNLQVNIEFTQVFRKYMINYISAGFMDAELTTALVLEDEPHIGHFSATSVSRREELPLLSSVGCEPLVISVLGDEANVFSSKESSALISASRRAWVLSACAVAALALVGSDRSLSWIEPAFADTPSGSGLDAFLALSQRLTGRTGLDATLGKRIYDALAKSDSQFTQNVDALNTRLQARGSVLSDTVTQALQTGQTALAKSVGAIMRAWYLGLVGDMPHVNVVAYEKALMFEPVKDVLTIPSYCRDAPFYWAQKPQVTLTTVLLPVPDRLIVQFNDKLAPRHSQQR
jgi:hypothetical protein